MCNGIFKVRLKSGIHGTDRPGRSLWAKSFGPYRSRPCPSFCTAQNFALHCTKFALHKICGITRLIRAIFKDENFENIRFSLEERRNHVTLVCQNITYGTTFWEEHNGTNFVDVPSKLGFLSIISLAEIIIIHDSKK